MVTVLSLSPTMPLWTASVIVVLVICAVLWIPNSIPAQQTCEISVLLIEKT